MIVEARVALALGNVGTALEAFRKALRQQPDSIEALAGIAACYERMGRYDLSRVNYEAALALAPNNPILLSSFAASLHQQGRFAEAAALRAEAAQADAAEVASTVQMAQADIAPVTIFVPPVAPTAKPSPAPTPVTPPAPPVARAAKMSPAPVAPVVAVAPARKMAAVIPPATMVAARPAPKPVQPVEPVRQVPAPPVHTEVVGNTEWTIEISQDAPRARSVTFALPPVPTIEPMPVPAPKAAPVAAIALREQSTPKVPATPPPKRESAPAAVVVAEPRLQGIQPRLQRLSMGEVALLTRNEPAWRTEVIARTQHSVTARFVPLKGATATSEGPRFVPIQTAMAANRPNVRVLNAARRQGLAARTRETLLDRGWRKIAIGDAAQVRARSIVLYPASRQVLGKRLAAQFGFASAINRRSNEVLVLLGSDAASLSFRRARA